MGKQKTDKVHMSCCGCVQNSHDRTNFGDNYKTVNGKIGVKASNQNWQIVTSQSEEQLEQAGTYTNSLSFSPNPSTDGTYLWPNSIQTFHSINHFRLYNVEFSNPPLSQEGQTLIKDGPNFFDYSWSQFASVLSSPDQLVFFDIINGFIKNAFSNIVPSIDNPDVTVNIVDDSTDSTIHYIFIPIYFDTASLPDGVSPQTTSTQTGWFTDLSNTIQPFFTDIPEEIPDLIQYGYLLEIEGTQNFDISTFSSMRKVKITYTTTLHIVTSPLGVAEFSVDGNSYSYLQTPNPPKTITGGYYYTYDSEIEDTELEYGEITSDGNAIYIADWIDGDEIIDTSGSYNIMRSSPRIWWPQLLIEITSGFSGSSIFDSSSGITTWPEWGYTNIEWSSLIHTIVNDIDYNPMVGPIVGGVNYQYEGGLSWCSQQNKTIIIDNTESSQTLGTEVLNGWSNQQHSLYCPHNQKDVLCGGLISTLSIKEGRVCDDLVWNGLRVGDIANGQGVFTNGYTQTFLSDFENPADKDIKNFTNTQLTQQVTNVSGQTIQITSTNFYRPYFIANSAIPSTNGSETSVPLYSEMQDIVDGFSQNYNCKCLSLGDDSADNFLSFNYLLIFQSTDINQAINNFSTSEVSFKAVPKSCNDTNFTVEGVRGFQIDDVYFDNEYAVQNIFNGPQPICQFQQTGSGRWESLNNVVSVSIGTNIPTPSGIDNFIYTLDMIFSIDNNGIGTLNLSSVHNTQTLISNDDTLCNKSKIGFTFGNALFPFFENNPRVGQLGVILEKMNVVIFPMQSLTVGPHEVFDNVSLSNTDYPIIPNLPR